MIRETLRRDKDHSINRTNLGVNWQVPIVTEPLIDGQPATEFVVLIVDRVCCFVEELCMFALQARMPQGISIAEIPLTQRKPEIVERFQLALVGGGMPIWSISYHDSKFEDT